MLQAMAGLPDLLEPHMTPPMATDAEHPATGCGVLPTGFWPPSGSISPCYTSVPPFQMRIFTLCSLLQAVAWF